MNNYIQAASKESLETFFGLGNKKPFLIPEYQRSYEWGASEINALLSDLINFNDEELNFDLFNPDSKADDEYFIGTIIYFENPDEGKRREIVDGQQRIVSIFLMFRAIYEIIDKDERFDEIQNLYDTLKKLIWETDPKSGEVISPNISSRAISDSENQIFTRLLESGKPEKKRRDNYSQNYRIIKKTLDEIATDPDRFTSFVLRLMKQTIVLPIEATSFDATLEIFERINDRGKQLTDSDIFKAKIYTALTAEKRQEFAKEWQSLDEDAQSIGITMKDLFAYQMYYERALNPSDDCLKSIGLRNFFLYESTQMKNPKTLLKLRKIFDLINLVKNRGSIAKISWSRDEEIRKLLEIVWNSPSEYWTYPVVTYYVAQEEYDDFETEFPKFLKKLIATMSRFYISDLSANQMYRFVMDLNNQAIRSMHPRFDLSIDDVEIPEMLESVRKSPKLTKLFLHELAYAEPEQKNLLPIKWDIEYVYPRYESRGKLINDERKELIEEIGNLTPLDRRLKHVAVGNFLMSKKLVYRNTGIAMTHRLGEKDQWTTEDIKSRSQEMLEDLKSLWDRWDSEYDGSESE